MALPTREQLVKRRGIVIADAQMKLECADWHGCADACMDLREIDAKIELWDTLREHGALIGANVLEQTGAFAPATAHVHLFAYSARSDSDVCACGEERRVGLSR